MDGLPDKTKLIGRFQRKLDKLEKICMERYQTRQQRILTTINFCMRVLEQLQNWALFAIFPTDEQHSRSYLKFVKRRFTCVMNPMRRFRDDREGTESRDDHVTPRGHVTPRDHSADSASQGSLRTQLTQMTRVYMDEAHAIKQSVEARVRKCRKDIRTVYRWCQASIMDLSDVIDDVMTDELYFLVRSKLARSLSSISALEEAADQVEKTLTHHFGNNEQQPGGEPAVDASADDESYPLLDAPWPGSPVSERSISTDSGAGTLGTARTSTLPSEFHIGHLLETAEDSNSQHHPDTSRSCPGPPRSPRPQGLINHPRILKDRMQQVVLHSTW